MSCPFSFSQLETHFPAEDRTLFFKNMGWDSFINNANYKNTCAMRVSVCLARLGVSMPQGQFKILKGPQGGQRVDIKWQSLTQFLTGIWGAPSIINTGNLSTYKGIIVFEQLPPDDQGNSYPGHIDVLNGPAGVCLYRSYFGSQKMSVWPV